MRVETASHRHPKSGLREISGFFSGQMPQSAGVQKKRRSEKLRGAVFFLVVLFCWYS